jgi:hypothetical protein
MELQQRGISIRHIGIRLGVELAVMLFNEVHLAVL